jgi:hypothetical protein
VTYPEDPTAKRSPDSQFRGSGMNKRVYYQWMGVGFQDSAPVVCPPLGEVCPPTAAEASAGMNQRLTLDHSSFEKLLAAAWVIQCLQDHLHGRRVEREETIAEPVATEKQIKPPSSSLQVAVSAVLQAPPTVLEADCKNDALNARPADLEALAELTVSPQPVETRFLNFEAAVKVEPERVEFKNSLPVEDVVPAPPVKLLPPALDKVANLDKIANNDGARAHDRSVFNRQTANFLRSRFNQAVNAFNHLLPHVRVNLSLRALRALAIATPVWLLSLVAALLFLEVWRHESVQSAQAISTAAPPAAQAAIGNNARTLTTTTRVEPEKDKVAVKKTENQPRWSTPVAPLEISHKHVTDPATLSAVEQLSRYEIRALRRQAGYGDESAAFTLGMAYEVGSFVPQNCMEAAQWVTTAAQAGDAAAQYNLGLRYRDGDGVPADRVESGKWLRKAATRNRQAKLALKMLASR